MITGQPSKPSTRLQLSTHWDNNSNDGLLGDGEVTTIIVTSQFPDIFRIRRESSGDFIPSVGGSVWYDFNHYY
jgi:hypothetical protein